MSKRDKVFFRSDMTFGQFVIGLFNESVFPYDRHLQFKSKTQGSEMGELLVGLLEKASFEYDLKKSKESGSCSVYVYKNDAGNVVHDLDGAEPYTTMGIERVVELTVWRPDYHYDDKQEQKFKMFFPPNCKIQIECVGYPF